MPKLVLLSGIKVAAKFPLTAEKTTLGRENNNDIVLEGSSVSREHARVVKANKVYIIEDLGSRNGILINGIRSSRETLRDGDEIAIGEYTFLYEEDVMTEDKGETIVAPFDTKKSEESELPGLPAELYESEIPSAEHTDVSAHEQSVQPVKPPFTLPAADEATIVETEENVKNLAETPARLLVLRESRMIQEHIIQTDIVTIGSDGSNILQLEHSSVSPFHAQVVKEGLHYKILDLETRNGTSIRGLRISQSTLRNGDEIGIGDFSLIFRDSKQVATPVAQSVVDRTDPGAGIGDEDDMTIVESEFLNRQAPPPQHPKFVMLEGPSQGQEFLLNKAEMKIGRDSTNHIVIKDESISRLHAIVKIQGNAVSIRDQESLNGIEIDGELVQETPLKRGDVIKLGTVVLRFIDRGEVYSIERLDQTGVTARKTVDHDESEQPETKKKTPVLRILLIVGIALLSFLLALSFFFTPAPTPDPTLSDIAPPVAANQPTRQPVSAISIYQLFGKGKDALDYHRWEQAIQFFDQVLEIKPDHEEARVFREQAQSELQNFETLTMAKRRQESLQEEDALRILEQIPPSSVYHTAARDQAEFIRKILLKKYLDVGNRYRRDTDCELAIAEYNKGLLIDPKDAALTKAKRECDELLARKKPTATTATAATTGDTGTSPSGGKPRSNPETLLQGGINDYINGDIAAALAKFQQIMTLGLPQSNRHVTAATKYIGLMTRIRDAFDKGQNFFNEGNVDRAYDEWKIVLELDRDIPKSRNSTFQNKISLPMAEKLFDRGKQSFEAHKDDFQLKEAYSLFEQAVTFNPNHAAAREYLERISEIAASVYREGYVRQDSDVTYALEKWRLVLQIVPETNDYHQKSVKMIQRYDR